MPSSRSHLSRVMIVVVAMALVAGAGVAIATSRGTSDAASTTPTMAVAHPAVKLPKYVAMGSSFASGPSSNRRGVSNCGRSDDNYPSRVSEALKYRLVDVTCAGSTSSEILEPSTRYRKPAQIDAITSDTALVTITTGGNDVGYIGRLGVQSCINLALAGLTPVHCNANKIPSPSPVPDDFARVERNLEKIVREVHKRAPKARIVFVDYLPVVSAADIVCQGLPLAPWEIAEATFIADTLAGVTASAARATGSTLVQASQAGKAHTVCSPEPWLQGFPGRPPYHPTTAGKAGVAQLVVDALRPR